MNKTIIKISMLFVLIVLESCSKEEDIVVVPEKPVATLLSIYPTNGPKNTLVTINGTNFGSDKTKVQVFFNGKKAEIDNLSDTVITAIVPPKASTGTIGLKVEGKEAVLGPRFVYELTAEVNTYVGAEVYLSNARGVAIDKEGTLYIADKLRHAIFCKKPNEAVKIFAGNGEGMVNGNIDEAKFNSPSGIAVDEEGNILIADSGNNRIRKITPEGMVYTLAGGRSGGSDGQGMNAQFSNPSGIALGPEGNIYVSDSRSHRIRKITPEGLVSTLAGSTVGYSDGFGNVAQFYNPMGLTVDSNGIVYVADNENQRIRKIMPNGEVTTLTGKTEGFKNGSLETALFDYPSGVAIDNSENLIIADTDNHRIRIITKDGSVKTLAGSSEGTTNGTGVDAKFKNPYGICIGPQGSIYVADTGNHSIRKIILE
ncbi:IPT/TIG domain-containing protein [Spongiimicrobium sp. 3-5]|uniref:IPT/TIG domain-containing protein n=1 Tax=Spongiimicrobium sp. 3-5 TaxID=3332596 RepID=UPI0039814828